MAIINVYLLNFHGVVSHLELLLQDAEQPRLYYAINRWAYPFPTFMPSYQTKIASASSVYAFSIDANPRDIIHQWTTYFYATKKQASLLDLNCAEAVQWFLTTFAGIPYPKPFNAPLSINHVAFGFFLPSPLPCPWLLPGRVMSHAQYWIEKNQGTSVLTPQSSNGNRIKILTK